MALNFITFNQDNSLLGVASSKGFRQYTTEPFSSYYSNNEGDVAIVEMLFSTSLVALVLSPRLLRILNTKRHTTICELTFPTKIMAVRMNRKRLAVVLDDSIYMYDISNMKLLQTVETPPNPNALCVLSPSSENNYMIYPLPSKPTPQSFKKPSHAPPNSNVHPPPSGEVMVLDANKMESVNVIQAHQSAIGCITINTEGTLLATASEKGTVIRVFSLPEGRKLHQFRRGALPASIHCMSFNSTATLLAVSSGSETVHLFRLAGPPKGDDNSEPPSPTLSSRASLARPRRRSSSAASEGGLSDMGGIDASSMDASTVAGSTAESSTRVGGLAGMLRRTSQNVGLTLAARVGGYLPSSVTEMLEPERDFARVRIPRLQGEAASGPLRSVVAMSANRPQLMVVTSEGQFYVFNIDLENGGEGVLEYQYSVLPSRGSMGNLEE
ncbi:WD40 repeat-like protein [Trichodelitschia bisporula]|uniref:WD40 repeat-like protein n=1 Tax=Trichodelitschia bisporula TaxID=703511 RepID=A0A6G1HLE2_9PEZI|nr:WD40 repeat-like protein [Trichodelitschia bisporula]